MQASILQEYTFVNLTTLIYLRHHVSEQTRDQIHTQNPQGVGRVSLSFKIVTRIALHHRLESLQSSLVGAYSALPHVLYANTFFQPCYRPLASHLPSTCLLSSSISRSKSKLRNTSSSSRFLKPTSESSKP